jgi:hypothetical protein
MHAIESDSFCARPRETQVRQEVIRYAFEDENEHDDEDDEGSSSDLCHLFSTCRGEAVR